MATTLTRNTTPEQWPAFFKVEEIAQVLPLSVPSIREAIRTGAIPKVDLPTENVLIACGTVRKLACLADDLGEAHELARREAAVSVARAKVGALAGELREAEEALRLAEVRLQEWSR